MSVPVILDTDIGSDIDDVYALALALNHPNLELRGVTTVGRFPQGRARLAAKILRLFQREEIGVYAGAAHAPERAGYPTGNARGSRRSLGPDHRDPLTHTHLVAADDPEADRVYGDAVEFILRVLDESSDPVTIVGIGGWTNVAEVICRATPAQLEKIKLLAMMGGEVHLLRRESNASFDPVATQIVLDAEIPRFIATWSPSRKLTFPMDEIDALLRNSESPALAAIYEATYMWRRPGSLKPGPVCYDLVPLFWAAGDRDAIRCIRMQSVPVELYGALTSGITMCDPFVLMRAEQTSETSRSYVALTEDIDADVLKARVRELFRAIDSSHGTSGD